MDNGVFSQQAAKTKGHPTGVHHMHRAISLTVICAIAAGCSRNSGSPPTIKASHSSDPLAYFSSPKGKELARRRLREVFGERGIEIAQAATRVETFRILDPSWHPKPPAPCDEIDGFPVTAKGIEQNSKFAAELAKCLLDGRIYCFTSPECLEDPGVAFRLIDGSSWVDLITCYECYHIQVFVHDDSGGLLHQGSSFFSIPLDGPDMMRALAKQAFPSDPAIQSLEGSALTGKSGM